VVGGLCGSGFLVFFAGRLGGLKPLLCRVERAGGTDEASTALCPSGFQEAGKNCEAAAVEERKCLSDGRFCCFG